MDGLEMLVLVFAGLTTFRFFAGWYPALAKPWPPERTTVAKLTLGALPIAALLIIIVTLSTLAAFDVVGDGFWMLFYILLGFAWVHYSIVWMHRFFDLSWRDDALYLNNRAALVVIFGGVCGLTAIYAGANIGDGPGWWCVIFAGGLGLVVWFLLGKAINLLTDVFERITVERDLYCGIRMGCYFIASGIILGRASGGDWTSFSMTVVEFMDGWPVLVLAAVAVLVERVSIKNSKAGHDRRDGALIWSVAWGALYIVSAVAAVILLPSLVQNPIF